MSSHSKGRFGRVLVMLPAMIAVLSMFGTLAIAQDQPAPKWELFGGYSFWHPGADVHGTLPLGLIPLSSRLEPNPRGAGVSVTYNFNRWFGLTLDTSTHWGSREKTLFTRLDDAALSTLSVGPKITFRTAHFSPFLEALVGDHRLMPDAFHDIDRLGFMAGGGLDVNLSRHVALRLIRADFVMSNYRYGPAASTPETELRGVRLQTGLVLMFGGGGAVAPVAASCSVNPSEVMVGEPVTANVTASNFNPHHTLTYTWSSTGGKVSGNNTTTSIDTSGVAGGSYTVTARVSDPKRKKDGEASCSSNFAVKEPPKNPPIISCSANPRTVLAGAPSTISCTCTSPDNAQLQPLAWQASSGRIAGEGMNGTLDTSGAGAGTITVTTTCTDVRGLSSSARTNVNVEAPQAPPPPTASKINECSFPNKVKPARVDNACKAALDDVALRLQREADAKAVIVGQMEAGEKPNTVAAQRAVNTKDYLVNEKQIDASRFETRTGQNGGQRVEIYLVPAGATFDQANTIVVTAPSKRR